MKETARSVAALVAVGIATSARVHTSTAELITHYRYSFVIKYILRIAPRQCLMFRHSGFNVFYDNKIHLYLVFQDEIQEQQTC